ncbi:MAG: TolC family protein [Saccharospirillaceae bacterium]|nr:TolC family protein [Pseudomonadales bacterium]NRB79711.1 TolC family protein [Saccharospirillaceae bacterium]
MTTHFKHTRFIFSAIIFNCALALNANAQSLESLIDQAIFNDPWLKSSNWTEQAFLQQAEAKTQWMDPTVQVSLANLAINSFDFKQEAMTQFKVSAKQMLPNTQKLNLEKQVQIDLAQIQPILRIQREAKLALSIKQLWLNAYQTHLSIELIEKNYQWFEQIIDLNQTRYQTGFNMSDSQNILEAQVALLKIDDRLLSLKSKKLEHLTKLSQYIFEPISLTDVKWPNFVHINIEQNFIIEAINSHPLLQVIIKRAELLSTKSLLVNTTDDLNWNVGVAYSYRADSDNGIKRSDLLSISVGVNIPYFSKNKTQFLVQSNQSKQHSLDFERQTLVNQLKAQFNTLIAKNEINEKRIKLNDTQLITKSLEYSDVALNAYTTNSNDFSKVLKAKIEQLNTELTSLELIKNKQFIIADYQFLTTGISL